MQHITYADKSILMGDAAAKTALEYAAELAHSGDADDVQFRAISSDGDNVEAILLLGGGSPIMAESAHTQLPEPDNTAALEYMKGRLDALRHVPVAGALDPDEFGAGGYFEYEITGG